MCAGLLGWQPSLQAAARQRGPFSVLLSHCTLLDNRAHTPPPHFPELTKSPPEGVSVGLKDDNLFHWTVMIVGPSGTSCEGGFFKAEIKFPENFPNLPPEMRFISQMWHPNSACPWPSACCLRLCAPPSGASCSPHPTPTHPLPPPLAVYADGRVCISILHPPGVDSQNAGETADERWRPILGVESILVSVISMLGDPNSDSPANVDAAKMWREDPKAFKRKVRQCVERTQE